MIVDTSLWSIGIRAAKNPSVAYAAVAAVDRSERQMNALVMASAHSGRLIWPLQLNIRPCNSFPPFGNAFSEPSDWNAQFRPHRWLRPDVQIPPFYRWANAVDGFRVNRFIALKSSNQVETFSVLRGRCPEGDFSTKVKCFTSADNGGWLVSSDQNGV